MKRILVVCRSFYPANVIGALRSSKVAAYLTKRGYEVDVFTKRPIDERNRNKFCSYLCPYAPLQNVIENLEKTVAKERKKRSRIKDYRIYKSLFRLRNQIFELKECTQIFGNFKRLLQEDLHLKGTNYDVIWTSCSPLASIFCGRYYKKLYPDVKWICDFRDPIVNKRSPALLWPYYRHLQNQACRKADAIVAVSNGYLERICKGKYADKAYMIPNGYDTNDRQVSGDIKKHNSALTLTYVGALYGGDRDLSPVFRAIRELIDENKINKICVNYAGTECDILKQQAQKYNLASIVRDNGVLSRIDCLNLQFSSDLLLLSTWNERNEYGVFPGKFLEYMLIGRPIISITSGDFPNGEVTSVMREGNFGAAYEEICDEADYPVLKNYLKKAYFQWSTDGKIAFEPVEEVLQRYNYTTIIDQIEEIING